MTGRWIGQYEIQEKLGAGGMGEVYKAHDAKLNRFVAVKALPAESVDNPELRKRLVREAQSASALNHPNIVTVHDIVTQDGADYLVMELIQGSSLSSLIPNGGMTAENVLRFGTQIASALSAAHGAGIVHRDLKPSNIMVTDSGHVKLLDFGLAKRTEAGEADPTRTALTREGIIIGTAAYMSPKQAEGKALDARSDVFSFGTVLYEMVTGRKTFQGDSQLSTLTAVLRDEPLPICELVSGVPTELERLIARCLRKEPSRRWQSTTDLHAVLAELKTAYDSGQLPPRTHTGSTWSGTWSPAVLAALHQSTAELEAPVPPVKSMRRTAYAAGGVALAVASAGAIWFAALRPDPKAPPQNPIKEAPRAASPPVQAPKPSPAPASTLVLLRDGLPVSVISTTPIRNDADEGTPLKFATAGDSVLDGYVVIARDSPVAAVVGEGKKKLLRRGSRVMVAIRSVRAVDGRTVRLRVSPSGNETTRPAEVPGSKGDGGIVAKSGTRYIAYVDGDTTVSVKR